MDITVMNPVAVTPDGGTVTPAPNSTRTQIFTVQNSWTDSRRFNITAACSGTATNCQLSKTVVGVVPGWPETVTVTYQVGAVGTTGVVSLTATDNIFAPAKDSGYVNVTSTAPPPAVAVTPHALPVVVAASSAALQLFTVTNTGGSSSTFNLSSVCSGVANTGCTVAPASLTLASGAYGSATVSYTVATSGTGAVKLRAKYSADTTVRDSGTANVTIGTQQAMTVDVNTPNPGTTIERGLCLTISAGAGAAYECGDLRLAHGLPVVQTLGKARAPTLLYNSQAARPYPTVAANVTRNGTTIGPDSVTATLTINGATWATGKWQGSDWSPAGTDRIVLSFDGWQDTTAGNPVTIHPYTVTVTNWYPTTSKPTTATGTLAVINRRYSELGAGWTIAGVEHLYGAAPTAPTILWADPDGSIRQYQSAQTNVWKAPALDRPDSLTWNGTNYIRWLPHGLQVQFDATGRHVYTVNRLGHKSTFFYTGTTTRLDSIEPAPQGSRLRTRFYYNGTSGKLDSVLSPGPNGVKRLTRFTIDARGRTTKIKDPDGDSVMFGYNTVAADSNYIVSRTNALGATLSFTYDAGHRLRQSSLGLGGGQTIGATYVALETRGLPNQGVPSAIDTALAYTKLDGPRTDVGDTTIYWLDKYGEPTRVQYALGQLTKFYRADNRWPALITRSIAPNGLVSLAWYNARATLDSSMDSSSYDPQRAKFAVSHFSWDATWDFVTQTIAPEGDINQFAYDPATGNRLWQQPGADSVRRVRFRYGNSFGLVSTVWTPGIATPDSVEYDARGNVARAITPRGFYSESLKDSLGRDTLVTSPIDSLQSLRVRERILYDLADQDTLITTVADANPYSTYNWSATYPSQSLFVAKTHDIVGRLLAVKQWSVPDTNHLGNQTRTYTYDSAGRKLAEKAPGALVAQSWAYDAAGNVTTYTSPNGLAYGTAFDELNRPVRRTAPQAGSWANGISTGYSEGAKAPADTVYFGYDIAGNQIRADNIYARIRRTFAQNGTLTTDSSWIRTMDTVASNFHVHAYGLRFRYDLEGRRTSLIHPSQLAGSGGSRPDSVAYGYDAINGALGYVDDAGRNRFTYFYDPAGRLDSLNGPGATGAGKLGDKRHYDADSRLVSRLEVDGSTTWHADAMLYDARGKILRADVLGNTPKRYGYSGLGAAVGTEAQNGDYHWSDISTPDAMGNLAAQQRAGTPHDFKTFNTYDAGGRLVRSISPKNLTDTDSTLNSFDSDGGVYLVQTMVDLGKDTHHCCGHWFGVDSTSNLYGEDGRLRYSWAKRDTLYGDPVVTSTHRYSQLEEYRYDALGRRIWTRNLRGIQCGLLAPDTYCVMAITRTVWDGSQILYEIRTNGDSAKANKGAWESDSWGPDSPGQFGRVGYTHGGGIDHPLSLARIQYLGGDVTMFLHADFRGALDGGTCFQNGATINCPNQFPVPGLSVAYDAPPPVSIYPTPPPWFGNLVTANQDASGYLFMRNRYYDPKSGRFTQADPIGLSGGLNSYGFADGDPVTYGDPFGLWGTPVHHYMMDRALPKLNKHDLAMVKKGSDKADGPLNQGRWTTQKHSMGNIFESSAEAKKAINHEYATKVEEAQKLLAKGDRDGALVAFGQAAHLKQDATSPWHTDAQGNARTWEPGDVESIKHVVQESGAWPTNDQLDKAVDDTQRTYRAIFGGKP